MCAGLLNPLLLPCHDSYAKTFGYTYKGGAPQH
ncbi:hypothetical protein EMIT0357P_40533 [Pseudomonas marginalis]